MTRKFRLTLTLLILFSSTRIFAATTQSNWIIAAQKFTFTRNQTGSVAEGVATMFPARILEKLSSNMYRNLSVDEKTDRELYKLKQERNSLFLQLSSEVKKRDSLVLEKYSQSELNRKLADADKKVEEIKKKLADNLKTQSVPSTVSQMQDSEKITLYKNDISALFNPSEQVAEQGIKSAAFEREAVNANINCLITGSITSYDEYMLITVQAVLYPGAKVIAVVSEVGSINDADLICSNIVRELAPAIANSLPVQIRIKVVQPQNEPSFKTYIDDILYSDISQDFTIDSGVHFIQFAADGYKNAGTNYYFEGNKFYEINVELESEQTNTIYVASKKDLDGEFLINGISATPLADKKSKIVINGNAVLGEFITEDNNSAFLYIPQEKVSDGALYTAKLKPLNHSDYIEKYRRRMYVSYSVLVTSLVPTIITSGRLKNFVSLFDDSERIRVLKDQGILDQKFKEAKIWNTAAIVSTGVSIAAGVWFAFELYRYFNAANSVLPANTKIDFTYEEPEIEITEDIENVIDIEDMEEAEENNTTE